MAVAIAQWYVKKYSVVGGMLLLRTGLLDRSVRVVPVTRITALAAIQSLAQRLIGVWELEVQSPGDRNGSALTLPCLSGRRLDELRAALESRSRTTILGDPKSGPDPSTIQRYLAWRHTSVASAPAHGLEVIAVLTTAEMLIAAVTNSTIPLILWPSWRCGSGFLNMCPFALRNSCRRSLRRKVWSLWCSRWWRSPSLPAWSSELFD